MNGENQYPSRPGAVRSLLLPFLLLAISLAAIFIWQIVTMINQGSAMRSTRTQLSEALQKREELVRQSGELQSKLQAVVVDLLELAKTSEKAKAIVQKYNIQQAPPAAPAAATP
jgi:hypothetical protein